MSTGDLKNNLRKLQRLLQRIGYKDEVDYDGMSRGLPTAFLPIYNHALTSFSQHLVSKLSDMDLHLVGANDMRFVDLLYKVFRDVFDYKSAVPKSKFFTAGFSERKVIMCTDTIENAVNFHRSCEPRKPVKLKKQTDPFSVVNPGVADINPVLAAARPSSVPSGERKTIRHTRAKPSSNYSPALYTAQDSVVGSQTSAQPSVITLDIDTCETDERPHVEVIRNADHVTKEFSEDEGGEEVVVVPPSNPQNVSPEVTVMAICQKLEVLMQAVIGLERRQASVEEALAIQRSERHVEKEKEVLAGGQLENVLARLTLLESRMRSVEAKVPGVRGVRIVEGPTTEEWIATDATRSTPALSTGNLSNLAQPLTQSPLPPPSVYENDSPPPSSTERSSDTEASDLNGNDQGSSHVNSIIEISDSHPPVVSDLISQVVRENGSEISDVNSGITSVSEESQPAPDINSLSHDRREQVLRIQSMLAMTRDQLSSFS